MNKFLRENENYDSSTKFVAVSEEMCGVGSECEGYKLAGTYRLDQGTKTITNSDGGPMLVVDFDLTVKEFVPDYRYELAFGFENGDKTESGSFFRDGAGRVDFKAAYEMGGLMDTRNNDIAPTHDFGTWTGEAHFDEKNNKFEATAMRAFKHGDINRALKLGSAHKWGTAFKVKNNKEEVVA